MDVLEIRLEILSRRAPKASQGIRLPKNHHSPGNDKADVSADDDVSLKKMVVRLLETITMKLETSICIHIFSLQTMMP